MNRTIADQLDTQMGQLNSTTTQKEDTTMTEPTMEVLPVTDINKQEFTMEVNAPNDTQPKATINKEDRKMGTQTYFRAAYKDDLATAVANNNVSECREILMYGPTGRDADKVREIVYLKPNPERDRFILDASRMYSMDFELPDGKRNRERLSIFMRLIGYDTDREGNPKENPSMYNILKIKAGSEIPTLQKVENKIISGVGVLGELIGAFLGAGTMAFGKAVAVGLASAMQTKVEMRKTYLTGKINSNTDPELLQLEDMWVRVQAMNNMAADAQDKDTTNESK